MTGVQTCALPISADLLADPEVRLPLTGRSGPLVVEIEYRVDQESARAFHGVMQDVHWAEGIFGYFPTYALGNVIAGQVWARVNADVPDLDERFAAGEFAPLREWLAEHVHRFGRRLLPTELLPRVAGEGLDPTPYLDYLEAKVQASAQLMS